MPIGSILGGIMGQAGAASAGAAAGRAGQDIGQQRQNNSAAVAGQQRLNTATASPWYRVGTTSQDLIAQLLGLGHAVNNSEGGWDLDASNWQGDQATAFSRFQASPDYDFRRTEGINALDRSASSKGMLMSGAQTKGVQEFGGKLASAEYNNWFNKLADRSAQGMSAGNASSALNSGLTGQLMTSNGALTGMYGNALMAQGAADERGTNALASGIGHGLENLTSIAKFNPWGMFGAM